MADHILVDGDLVVFIPAFIPAMVVVKPGTLSGSGAATISGKKVCVEGDEANVAIQNCQYLTGQYSIPGTGTLKIKSLAADQKAKKTTAGGKPVLLRGGSFTAVFEVVGKAGQPNPPGPPVSDPTTEYSGSGTFVTTNVTVKGA